MKPSITWVPTAVILGLVLTAVIAYFVAERRARRERTPRAELAEELAAALDDALDDLRAETDPRRAVIAAYARIERVLASSGIARRPAETSDEYLARVLRDLALGSDAIARLTSLFTQAKFSQHEVDTAMKEEAIDSLERVRDELRDTGETSGETRIGDAAAVGATIVRREVRGALRLLVVTTLALVVVAAFVPGRLGLGARIYALVLCVTALALASSRCDERSRSETAAPRARRALPRHSATSKPRTDRA